MSRLFLFLACVLGFAVVALAAAGAHLFPGDALFQTALQMQAWHVPVVLAVGVWLRVGGGVWVRAGGGALVLGLVLFCGALYAHAVTGVSLGPVAPVGGTLMMLGWLGLAVAAARG